MSDYDQSRVERAQGVRHRFFDDPNIDRLLSIILELASEVSVLRDRLDTHERLSEEKGGFTKSEVDDYFGSPDIEAQRQEARSAYVQRLMKNITEEMINIDATDGAEAYNKVRSDIEQGKHD